MKNDPVPLYDKSGCYSNFIEEKIIPGIFAVIEQSGISFEDAKMIPMHLERAIQSTCVEHLSSTKFSTDQS